MLDRIYPGRKEHGWMPIIWLMYLVFLFIDPFFAKQHAMFAWIGTISAIVVFLPFYIDVYSSHGWRAALDILVMVILGIVCLPWNSGAFTFFIYATASLPWVTKGAKLWGSLIVIVAIIMLETRRFHFPAFVPFVMAFFAVVICAANYHFAQKKIADKKLRLAQDEVEHLAKVAERERIARDLHDLLGHTLSLITLKAELARKLVDRDPARAKQEMLELEQTSRAALADVRETISGYRGQGLAAELVRSRKILEAAGIELEIDTTELPLTATQEAALTLALREAVTNVVRHSQAQHCRIRMGRDDNACTLEVADNGRGSSGDEGNGLRGMRERLESIGGSLQRQVGTGTSLVISVPVAQTASAVRN